MERHERLRQLGLETEPTPQDPHSGVGLGLHSGRQVREHFRAGGQTAATGSTASNGVDAGSGLLWR